nr:MAG TPA: hypothetical protein [Caudoviricetes sp.]
MSPLKKSQLFFFSQGRRAGRETCQEPKRKCEQSVK